MATFNDKPVYTLTQVAQSVQSMIERTYKHPYYIQAEMIKLNMYPRSGHCFPELVEKENGRVKTQMRAIIWHADYERINANFQKITGESLKDGITVLCLATIEFSPKYGLALYIQNIEPTFTLGEMAREKQQTVARLKAEGIFDANKRLSMPLLPQRIAVISIETSKGYSDFMVTLRDAKQRYRFDTELFPSLLQGEKAVATITGQLDRIQARAHEFDCVAIIRGGGGDVGLNCYDQYELASRVATFPLPVLTGIGHSTNATVTESVAFDNKITPTEVAYFLIGRFSDFEKTLGELQSAVTKSARLVMEKARTDLLRAEADVKLSAQRLLSRESQRLLMQQTAMQHSCKQLIKNQKQSISTIYAQLKPLVSARLAAEKGAMEGFESSIYIYGRKKLESAKVDIAHVEEKIRLLDPANVLRRGYSITYHLGRAVTDAAALKAGDELETLFSEGRRKSRVE